MTSRRAFLCCTLLTPALPLAARAAAGRPVSICAVHEARSTRARAFAAALENRAETLDGAASLDDLEAFEALLAERRWDAIAGLTRDADAFVLGQCAAAHGYRLAMTATHAHARGATRHALKGEHATVERLARTFGRAQAAWPLALAAAMPDLARAAPGKRRAVVQGADHADAVGWLTSWILRRD